MPKRRSTPADQTAIEGTGSEEVELTAAQKKKLHRIGNQFSDQSAQKKAWHDALKETQPKVDQLMDELGLDAYVLPAGHRLSRSSKSKVSVKLATNEDGTVHDVELETLEVG